MQDKGSESEDLTRKADCTPMLALPIHLGNNSLVIDLAGLEVWSHTCDHPNNKPPCKLAILQDLSRHMALFWKGEFLGYNVK